MVPIGSPLAVFCLTSNVYNIVSLTVFEIFDAEVLWPRSKTVQGHPRLKVTVSIDSPWVICYLTSIDLIVVSVTILINYFTCKFADLEIGQCVQGHPRSNTLVKAFHDLFIGFAVLIWWRIRRVWYKTAAKHEAVRVLAASKFRTVRNHISEAQAPDDCEDCNDQYKVTLHVV